LALRRISDRVLILRVTELSTKVFRSVGKESWALADQCLVSGCNFGTGVILARLLGLQIFGVYTLWYAVLMYLNTIQLSLIVSPMLSLAPRLPDEERKTYLNGLFAAQLIVTAVLCAVVAGGSGLLMQLKPAWRVSGLVLPFTGAVLFFQLQDWLRRYFYVLSRGRAAFMNDLISYAGQIVMLLTLWHRHSLNLVTAYWAVALTSSAAFLAGLFFTKLCLGWQEVRSAFSSSWRFARDMFAAAQIQWLGSQGVLFVAGAIVGTTAVGGVRIAQNLAGPIIVFFQALENVLPVRAGERLRQAGRAGLIKFLQQATLTGTALVGAAAIVIGLFAGPVLGIIYGPSTKVFAAVLVWQLVYFVVQYPFRTLSYFHRAIGETSVIVVSTTLAAVLNIIAAFVLVPYFSANGVMMAVNVGQFAGLVYLVSRAHHHDFAFLPRFAARAGGVRG
jgi:O-antigen/teichoic acid export membrane protein